VFFDGRGTPVVATPKEEGQRVGSSERLAVGEKVFIIDNLMARIHSIIEMILVYRPCATGV
jgi:hypothetical protein